MHHILTQYTIKAVLQWYKEWGKNGVDAELKQIHDKLTFSPIKKSVNC